jgi:hypothetical protein
MVRNWAPQAISLLSVALVHNLILVTHNPRDFENIPRLRLEDWLRP